LVALPAAPLSSSCAQQRLEESEAEAEAEAEALLPPAELAAEPGLEALEAVEAGAAVAVGVGQEEAVPGAASASDPVSGAAAVSGREPPALAWH
jgi:hypothetical protein